MTDKRDETVQLKLRFRESLRVKVEQSATAHANSLNAEIVSRLARSFDDEERMGAGTAAFLRAIAAEIWAAEHATGQVWTEDAVTFYAAKKAIERKLSQQRPAFANQAEIDRAWAALKSVRDQINSQIDYLCSVGAVERVNALHALWAYEEAKTPAAQLLKARYCRLLIDPAEPVSSWKLARPNGEPMELAELIGVKSVLSTLEDFAAYEAAAKLAYTETFTEEARLNTEGDALAHRLANPERHDAEAETPIGIMDGAK